MISKELLKNLQKLGMKFLFNKKVLRGEVNQNNKAVVTYEDNESKK